VRLALDGHTAVVTGASGRVGRPGDVATIAFLRSDAARLVTAQVLPVDGGWSA
jgi:NAD(P)-dependent dehydrogenase (short-subunit alcohol dehydrogenase family)